MTQATSISDIYILLRRKKGRERSERVQPMKYFCHGHLLTCDYCLENNWDAMSEVLPNEFI